MKKTNYERTVFLSDLHIPFQDHRAVDLTMDFIKWFEPSYIFIVGDLLDFYALSFYDKNPERANKLQDELDGGYEFLRKLRDDNKKATIKFLGGN